MERVEDDVVDDDLFVAPPPPAIPLAGMDVAAEAEAHLVAPAGDVHAEAALGLVEAVAAPRAGHGERGFAWGPFFISKIYRGGELVGRGARCGLHRNAADGPGAVCKKSVQFGTTGCSEQDLVLRLKRWLVAGLDDGAWADDVQRGRHMAVGGVGLRDLAEGLPEADLDRIAGVA